MIDASSWSISATVLLQARVQVPWEEVRGATWRLTDALSDLELRPRWE